MLKNVFRRKVRTALTTFGVAVAIAAVVSLLSITGGYEQLQQGDVRQPRGRSGGGAGRRGQSLDQHLGRKRGEAAAGAAEVGKVAPALSEKVSFEAGSLVSVPVNGWPPDSFAFDSLTIIEGRKLESGDKHAVMLGKELANRLKKNIGDEVQIESEDVQGRRHLRKRHHAG